MTIKQQINLGTIQKLFHLHMAVFILFNSATLNFTLSPLLYYSLKIRNYEMREKKTFCICDCLSVSCGKGWYQGW